VLIWFAALSVFLVAETFKSPGLDYRLVVLGAVSPVLEGLIGGPWLLHTPLFAAVTLCGVMLMTQNRRLLRRRCLGIPIGLFAHLVLDATWADSGVFWWPFTGFDTLGGSQIREVFRWPGGLILEVIGIVIAFWIWKRYRLFEPLRRKSLFKHGRLERIEA